VDLLVSSALAKSRREAREFVAAGAVAINGEKVPADRRVDRSDLLDAGDEAVILLRRGRKQWHSLRFR